MNIYDHCWAVMWPAPLGHWHIDFFETEQAARDVYNLARRNLKGLKLVEMYTVKESAPRSVGGGPSTETRIT